MDNRVFGADVSHWQNAINWPKMSESGVKFCFIKATEGTGFKDGHFPDYWQGAKNEKILRGAYHFFLPHYSPVNQARHFFDTVMAQGDMGELPPVLDIERGPYEKSNIKRCLNEIERLFNIRPIIYTAAGLWNTMGGVNWAKNYKLWVAQYPYTAWSDGVIPNIKNMDPWVPNDWQGEWWAWQFTEKGPGSVYGTSTNSLDLNFYNGDLDSLRKFAGLPEEAPQPDKDLVEVFIDSMNQRKPDSVAVHYSDRAVHVTSDRTTQGLDAIRLWYARMFVQMLPGAVFKLSGYSGNGNSRQMEWTAVSDRGRVLDGKDTFGYSQGKIIYHFTSFTIGA